MTVNKWIAIGSIFFVAICGAFFAGRQTAPQYGVRYLHIQPIINDELKSGIVRPIPCGTEMYEEIEFFSPIKSGPLRWSVTNSTQSPLH